MYGIEITVGLILILVGMILWYFSSWLAVFRTSNNRSAILGIVGMLIQIWGFNAFIDYEKLNQYQLALGLFLFVAYMVIFMYAFNKIHKSIKANKNN